MLLSIGCSHGHTASVSWEKAKEILHSGEVEQVFQSHSKNVTLILKNGTTLNTVEPNLDDIFSEVKKCGEPCQDIILATE